MIIIKSICSSLTTGKRVFIWISNLSKWIPQLLALLGDILTLDVNLIPLGIKDIVLAKALVPIFVAPSAETVFKFIAPLKALVPILITVSGKVIEVILILFQKAPLATLVVFIKSASTKTPFQTLPLLNSLYLIKSNIKSLVIVRLDTGLVGGLIHFIFFQLVG